MINIRQATDKDSKLLADIISSANKDVAVKFGLNADNNSKHPSFCTAEWIEEDLKRGEIYFIYESDNLALGCVAFEQPDSETAYLNRLAVIPEYRNNGVGQKLVNYHLNLSKEKGIKNVSIGIIDKHISLKNWYKKLGFKESGLKVFDHLPFDVCFLTYSL